MSNYRNITKSLVFNYLGFYVPVLIDDITDTNFGPAHYDREERNIAEGANDTLIELMRSEPELEARVDEYAERVARNIVRLHPEWLEEDAELEHGDPWMEFIGGGKDVQRNDEILNALIGE